MGHSTSSKYSLYRGLIALAWADHELHVDEKATLHDIIDAHQGLTVEERAVLHSEVELKVDMETVWPDITEAQDRARLIDMANIIFQQDGEICDNEFELIETFKTRHFASLDMAAIRADLSSFSEAQAAQRDAERQSYKEWASQYSLMGRLKAAFDGK
ncbi:MAG: hypothetical protein CMK09_02280 [Ponticaulis sp.]|nr:hypothetical protein [Ponticaulis sp.]|tara:strand:- start:49635 stop:50108 length:474 start_codon:yes stop_codon:yes gene_type:complete